MRTTKPESAIRLCFSIAILWLCSDLTYASDRTDITFITVKGTIGAVNCFMQDAQGQIWLGSKDGMLISDGINFARHLGNIEHELKRVSVNSILNSGNNTYYVGTSDGMYKMNLENDSYEFIYETAAMNITGIFRFDDENIVLGTPHGPYFFNIKTGIIKEIDGFDRSAVRGIVKVNNSLAIANAQGVNLIDQHKHSTPVKGLDDGATAIFFDYRSGRLLVGTSTGVVSVDMRTDPPVISDVLKAKDIESIFIDSKEGTWIGTKSGIFYRKADNDPFITLAHNPIDRYSLIDNAVTCFFEDQGSNIWVGTKRGVSLHHHGKPIISHTITDVSGNPLGIMPSAIFKDSKGRLWIGTLGALYVNDINADHNTMVQVDAGALKGLLIRVIFEDTKGNVWFCTDRGVCRYLGNGKVSEIISISDAEHQADSDIVYSMAEIDTDNVAIGCINNGIFFVRLDDLYNASQGKATAYHWRRWEDKHNLDPDNTLAKLRKYRNDGIITPTGSGNVMHVTPKQISYYHSVDNSGRYHTGGVNCTYPDTDGTIWIGGVGHLGRVNTSTNRIESVEDKDLTVRNIIDILRQDDNLWIVFADGLGLWNQATDGIEIIANFNEPVSCVDYNPKEKTLYIGLSGKYCSIDLVKILKFSVYENLVYFTSLSVNNQQVRVGDKIDGNEILTSAMPFVDKITLNHDQNNITLRFVDGIRHPVLAAHYRYRLKGCCNDEWIDLPDDQKTITISGIRPGKYQLQLQRTDIFGTTGIERPEKDIDIEIRHPWWSNIYARCAYAVLGILLLFGGFRYYRVRNSLKLSEMEKKKVLELSNMKTEFLTNMSHEIKTPLTFMLENINSLLNTLKSSTQRSKVKSLHDSTMHISRIVHDMLNVEDEVPDDFRKIRIELNEFVGSIISTYLPIATQKNITLDSHLSDTPIFISGDPMKLEVAIGNLLTNAIKFTPEEGSIAVSVTVDGDEAIITVKDSGIGIKEKDIPFIFNRFYQGQNPEINKNGSGIGLSATKKYVESMSGTVEVSSQPGNGSTFTISIPTLADGLTEGPEGETPTDAEVTNDERRHTILIVEDNHEICQMLVKSLDRFNCIVAHNGKSGLEKALAQQPDIIISDIMMPIMDGIQMLKSIRRNVNTQHIPVIMLTAKDNNATQKEAISLGVDLFISKPFDPQMLKGYINRIITNRANAASGAKAGNTETVTPPTVATQQEVADRKFLEEINGVIEANLNDTEFNVEKLSTLTGYNSKQLYRRLKTLTGETAVGYIQSIRLKKAAALLRQRHYTVSEVMYAVGYSNASYFSKCFAAKYGVTPSEYMEK